MTIRRVFAALALVFVGWITVMALVMRFSDAAPAAVVLLPSSDFVQNLPPGAAILSANSFAITISGDVPSMGAALYKAGALLVLPAGLTGCLPLPQKIAPPLQQGS